MVNAILQIATATFFPGGVSKIGHLIDFICEMKDFKGDEIPDDKNIEDLYKASHLKTLRLYLYTRSRYSTVSEQTTGMNSKTNSTDSSENELPDLPAFESRSSPSTSTTTVASYSQSVSSQETPMYNTRNSQQSTSQELDSPDPEISFHPRCRLSLSRCSTRTATTTCENRVTSIGQTAIEAIEVMDSEDEEIQRSNTGTSFTRVENADRGIDLILNDFRENYFEEGQIRCVILRSKPLKSAIHTLERNINFRQKLFVKFSGEIGEDHGGPRREFFRLALTELQHSEFFEGPEDQKVFTHNINLVEKNLYRTIGRLVALSLVHDGPGIHFMNSQLFNLMTDCDGDMTLQSNISSEEILDCLNQLEKMSTVAERDQFLVTYGDWLSDRGIGAYRMKLENKEEIVKLIIKYHVFYRTSAEIAQFKDGMNDVGRMWELIRDNRSSFEPIFCHRPKALTKNDFDNLCEYKFSIEGSNSRTSEEETVYAWETFLEAIEDGSTSVTFSKLMAFLTGSDNIPPCGFQKGITVHFYTQEVGVKRLPHVSTCTLDFWIPRGETTESFMALMFICLNESGGFLKV